MWSIGESALGGLRLKHDPEKWVPVFRKRSCSDKSIERDDDSKKSHHALMHRGRAELVLDVLVVIEPLDRVVELGAFFFRQLGLHLADRLGELGSVTLRERCG